MITPQSRKEIVLNRWGVVLAIVWVGIVSLTLDPNYDDFERYWQAAVDLQWFGDPYVTRLDYFYPPLFVYFIQPFALLSHETGQIIWLIINAIILASFLILCLQTNESRLVYRYWGLIVLVMTVAPPTRVSLQLGQVSILVALALIAVFLLARSNPATAGGILALISLIRINPALMGFYYLFRRPRRVVMWAVGIGIALVVGSLFLYGTGPYESYITNIVQQNATGEGVYPFTAQHNISIAGFWYRLFTESPYTIPITHNPTSAQWLTTLTSLIVVAVCIWAAQRGKKHGTIIEEGLRYSVWLCGMMLLFPTNGYYNLVILLFPFLWIMWLLERRRNNLARIWLAVATALVCIPPGWETFHPAAYQWLHTGWGVFFLTPSFYGTLLYLIILVWLIAEYSYRPTYLAEQQSE